MSELDALLDALQERIAGGVEESVRSAVAEELARTQLAAGEADFDLWRLYRAREAADILGLDRTTMYDIPESDLPRCRVGPARGSVRWLGADLLAYVKGLDPVDYEAVIEHLKEQLRRPHGSVQRLSRSRSGKKRVL